MHQSTLVIRATQFLLFLNTFVVESMFRQRDLGEKSIDLQVILKMGTWAFTLAFCLYFYRLWAAKMLRIDKFFELLLLFVVVLSCFYSPNIPYSLASAFSLVSVFALLFMSSFVLSNRQILWPIILGCTSVVFVSLIVYFAVPEFGRMKIWVDGREAIGSRLTGITGAANVVGYISAFCLLGLYYYRRYLPTRVPLVYWIFVGLNLIALLMSNSRTSLAALIVSVALASLVRMTSARFAAFFAIICLGIIAAVTINYDTLFSMLSRSGDASEITSGTGRTAIWSTVLHLIGERPLMGWGYASSIIILPEHSSSIGYTAAHAHNAFLQVLLTTGVFGLFAFLGVFIIKFYYALRARDPLNIAFITFLLIDGITEPIAFYGPATTSTLALATVLSLNYRDKHETDSGPYQQRLS
jgi:exopolysaccharide production protein ExoQ